MSESTLSFPSSADFRNKLLARNLAPYNVPGVYVPNTSAINMAITQTDFSVIDSPDELISKNPFADVLWVKNKYGPDGGFDESPVPILTYPVKSGSGQYQPKDTVLDLVNEFFIDAAYIENVYGPEGGYKDMYVIDSIQNNNKLYIPYWEPPNFLPSFYTPYEILTSTNPNGSNGPLSQDSFIARLGAETLRNLFRERIATEIYQSTVGAVNLASLQDPFEASLLITGQQPLVYRDWKITIPENPILRTVDLATRLSGAYWPVSPIPGDYFDENQSNGAQTNQTSTALSVINQATGGLLGPILNLTRNPSQVFLANTGNGQRSALFNNLDYNRYQPNYDRGLGGIAGIATAASNLISNLINDNGTLTGGFYVGNKNADPSLITSPPNQIPVNAFGQQDPVPVYGPSEMGILFEGNEEKLNFGLAGKNIEDGGGIDGQFVWVSPKYKKNLGYHPTVGGGTGSLDGEYNLVSSNITRDSSTNIEFKKSSILDQTQRLIDSADNVSGIARLKHVGNAINQVSKVFNDGYKEMTKGSQVLSYKDNTTGSEKGREYCRVFAKDTPYYTYNDLQKVDGITTSGRRFTNSVLDNTFNLNISPTKNPGSTNIIPDDPMTGKGGYVKKYMFSLENLAWRTSSRPGFTVDELPTCEKGPNGGRIMWFPPYDLKFTDSSNANWNETSFLGRPENIYTYKSTTRSGTLSWKIIVDSPSVLNLIVEKQLKGQPKEKINSILDSFFAGCLKYDIYELAKKYNQIPVSDLYTYQEILSDPRLTNEELQGVNKEIPKENTYTYQEAVPQPIQENQQATNQDTGDANLSNDFKELAFYFENNVPGPNDGTTANVDYKTTYDAYISRREEYNSISSETFNDGDVNRNVDQFFQNFVIGNFEKFTDFVTRAKKILDQEGSTITVTLQGSASAKSSVSYNQKLSKRRIDSIKKYFETTELKPFITDKKTLKFTEDPEGETLVIPTSDTGSGGEVNCNTDIKDKNNKVTENSQIFALSAMACRRVKVKDINIIQPPKPTPTPEPPKVVEPQFVTKTGTSATTETINIPVPKPQPQVEIKKKLKDGIGKKILRQLLTECSYFEVIKQDAPFVYDSIKEKIKYFSPAFHSMTPEGLNARLTFLNQCVRPGETIPIIGPDGKPRYNDAVNTAFGAPPILVLRIGDFYHSKIVPKSVQFSYENLDINPEGIGVQPMIANVSLNFDFIGGQGLARPVEQLQNALSFNYYANTEIYDERAVWTEDTSALDKTLVNDAVDGQLNAKPNTSNPQPNEGGSTIGEIITNIPVPSGQTGEIGYQKIMDSLLSNTKDYMITMINELEKINLNYNYGVIQLITSERDNIKWKVMFNNQEDEVDVFGTPSKVNSKVKTLFETAKTNVDDNTNPIIVELLSYYEPDSSIQRTIKTNIKNYLDSTNSTFSNGYTTFLQEIIAFEQNYFFILDKIDLLNTGTPWAIGTGSGTDGKLLSGNVPRVYNISGTTDVSKLNTVTRGDTYEELIEDYKTLKPLLLEYKDFLGNKELMCVPDNTLLSYNSGDFTPAPDDEYTDTADKLFFMIMSRILDNKNNKEDFITAIIKGVENEPKVKNRTENIVDKIARRYSKNLKHQEKIYSKVTREQQYKQLVNEIEERMYKKGKTRKFNYSTIPNTTTNSTQETAIKDLYLKPIKLTMNE